MAFYLRSTWCHSVWIFPAYETSGGQYFLALPGQHGHQSGSITSEVYEHLAWTGVATTGPQLFPNLRRYRYNRWDFVRESARRSERAQSQTPGPKGIQASAMFHWTIQGIPDRETTKRQNNQRQTDSRLYLPNQNLFARLRTKGFAACRWRIPELGRCSSCNEVRFWLFNWGTAGPLFVSSNQCLISITHMIINLGSH